MFLAVNQRFEGAERFVLLYAGMLPGAVGRVSVTHQGDFPLGSGKLQILDVGGTWVLRRDGICCPLQTAKRTTPDEMNCPEGFHPNKNHGTGCAVFYLTFTVQ